MLGLLYKKQVDNSKAGRWGCIFQVDFLPKYTIKSISCDKDTNSKNVDMHKPDLYLTKIYLYNKWFIEYALFALYNLVSHYEADKESNLKLSK